MIGRKAFLSTTAAALAGGSAAAINSMNPMQGAMNFSMQAVFDDPNVDNEILGRDLRFRDMFALPSFMQVPEVPIVSDIRRARQYLDSPVIRAGAFHEYKGRTNDQLAGNLIDRGYSREFYPHSMVPYVPSVVKRDNLASGDMVFGQYNLRHGF